MRVGLVVEADAVRIRGQGEVAVRGASHFQLAPGEEARVVPSTDGVRVEGRSGGSRRLTFESREDSRYLLVNGREYRGSVEVISNGATLTTVNVVSTEAYLRGVVGVEMGLRQRNERAALEAQAIASRTYALKNRGRFRAAGFDLRAGVQDQAYLGVERETELGSEAVRSTAGLVVTYRGDLISAFFHSTCGYSTASPAEAFRTVQAVPYLRPVSDRRPSTGYYCDLSPRFRWTVEWEGNELRDILRQTVPTLLGVNAELVDEVYAVRVQTLGPSRRVTELRLQVGSGEIPVYGPDLRRVFLTPERRPLGSTAIEISTERLAGGGTSARITGAGWGHGVGMCQWGALGRARAGQTAQEILQTYYQGTRLERRY
ncbi:SpoIID/LytB domain-containing protein [Gemmatimonadota bacterium]